MSFKDRLKKMQGKMAEQQADYIPGGNFQPIPDGDYTCRIKATLDETKKAPPRLMVSFCYVVAEGEKEGRQVWNNCILEDNKVGAQIARGIIEDLGYEWPADDLGVLEDIVADITERSPLVEITAKSKEKDGYINTNVRITNVLEMPEGADDAGEQTQEQTSENDSETTEQPSGGDDKTELLDFAASQGIDGFSEDNELADMVEALKDSGLTFKEGTLSEEEKALFDRLDLSSIIEKEKVIVKAKTKPTLSKKPALKTTAKKGKK